MSAQHKENPGRGLSEEDLALIFPEAEPQNLKSAPTETDYKKKAVGKHDDDLTQIEQEPESPMLENEPWPDPPEEMKSEIVSYSETHEQRVQGEVSPSDKTWRETIKNIFGQSVCDRPESAGRR